MSDSPRVSFVIPTYNERGDIRATLEAVLAIRHADKEVLVVDDSTDDTPAIAREYAARGVRVLSGRSRIDRRAANTCGARNIGIREAKGDIVVFFNADNRPSPDFLERVLPHYRAGADYVIPTTEVVNQESVFARFIGAMSHHVYDGQTWIEWQDGLSCRRDAAIAVGLFPEFPVPLSAGEDGVFGFRLGRRFRKTIDSSVVVLHVAPSTLGDYWSMRAARGRATPTFKFFIAGHSLTRIAVRVVGGTVVFGGQVALVVPVLRSAWAIAAHSPRGRRDTLPFAAARAIELLARIAGEWASLWDLAKHLDRHRRLQAACIDPATTAYFERAGRAGTASGT